MTALVIATNNIGKRDEMRALLSEVPEFGDFELITMREAGFPDWDPEETGVDFSQNALIKARSAVSACGLPALADDSGLCIDALGGAPGLKSARWLGAGASEAEKNKAVLNRMAGFASEDRAAHFICALALALPGGAAEVREGFCYGRISLRPQGDGGFGYDPIFIHGEGERTLAQMSSSEKNAVSHRRAAWRKLAPIMLTHLQIPFENGS